MASQQPIVIAAGPRQRRFVTSAVAMQAIIIADLNDGSLKFHASVRLWMLKRAVELYRLWQGQPEVPLQRELD